MRSSIIKLLPLLFACGGATGQREFSYPVVARGELASPFDAGGWEVVLSTAEVGFGPAYFCATASASADLCPTAISQFARGATINGLDPGDQPLGDAEAQTGTVRSATYDFALTWSPTQRRPTPAPGAPRGHSAYFEGEATKDGRTVRFVAAVDVVPRFQGTRAVQGAAADVELGEEGVKLTVTVRPSTWWRAVDFERLAQQPGDPVSIVPGTPAHEALVFAMTAGAPPSLSWSPSP